VRRAIRSSTTGFKEIMMSDNDCRANLIAAAVPLFAAKGFKGVSVREVAAATGVNLSMISYYFGGKEGLYAAVLKEQFAVLEKIGEIEQMDIDTLQKFELYVRATVSRYRKSPYLLRFYTSELTNPTPCFETIVKPAIKGVVRILLDTFSEGLSHAKFREGLDPADTVLALAGMINFYFLLEPATAELVDHSPERDEKLIRHIMDIFSRGVLS
jgi:TetR/AcrR family transcriptional regulator